MDLSRPVLYRGFYLNDPVNLLIQPNGTVAGGIAGSLLEEADFSDFDVVQFLEKKALSDGMDAGDVFLGGRRLGLAGTIYAATRPLLFDTVQALRAVMSPTLAFRESPADKGYRPLYFSVPTNRVEEYTSGGIDLQMSMMPRKFTVRYERRQQGSNDALPLAAPWTAILSARDPRILGEVPVDVAFTANASGTWVNRGDYYATLNMLLDVGSAGGSVTVAVGDSNFTITVPASTGNRIIRYDGYDKVLTLEEANVEQLRMDLITFQNQTTHPLIPHGASPYSFSKTGVTLNAGTHAWFWEVYA